MNDGAEKERKGEKAEKYFWSKKRRIGVELGVEVGRRGRVAAIAAIVVVVIAFGSDSSTDIQLGGAGKATKKLGGGGGGVGGEEENQLGDRGGTSGDICSDF